MTRAVTDGTERARLAGDLSVFARVLIEDDDDTWRDLTNLYGVDWVVRVQFGATIDDAVMSLTVTLVREGKDTSLGSGTLVSLAPMITASPANRNAANVYAPLCNPARRIRVLTSEKAYGSTPSGGDWKRVFDGKIDFVDPAAGLNTMTLRARDRGAWLLNTWIEDTTIVYGSVVGDPVESVVQEIIDDSAVPYGATLDVPESPDFNVGEFNPGETSVMEAIRNLALLQGGDIRWIFPYDGDTDPVLRYTIPVRDKTVPDWTFGPTEYTELARAPISDDDVRNAIEISYIDSLLGPNKITRINATSITAFGRRFGRYKVANPSLLDSEEEVTTLGDAMVNDLGSPPLEHEMRTPYFWLASLGDLVRFLPNATHHDQNQDLATVGYEHTIENGQGWTVWQCRGTPAGAYREWLAILSTGSGPGGTFPSIEGAYEIVSQTSTQITIALTGTAPGTTREPAVRLIWLGYAPPVSRISGADVGVYTSNGSVWTFSKPSIGSGAGAVGFMFSLSGYSDTTLVVPIPEATGSTGPVVNTPTFTVNVDPTNSFVINWTVSGAPSGATYKAFWRIGTSGPWQEKSAGTSLTATILNTEHGHVLGSSGGTVRAFQSYVEMDTSGGAYQAQSAIGSVNFNDLGLG